MERINLETQLREQKGKQLVKRLRQEGFVPAVVYKGGGDNLSLKLSEKDFLKVIGTKAGSNVIINLKITQDKKGTSSKSAKDKTVIIKDIQRDPVRGNILHIDFNEISLTETLKFKVKIEAKGEPVGVKEGGTLEHIMWETDVECLPTQIPEKLEVDVTNLKIGDSVFVKDIIPVEGVKILQTPDLIVMSVKPPFVEKAAEEVPAEGAPEEPELIRKKKEEEGEEAEGEEGKKEEPKKEAAPKEEKKKEEKKKEEKK
ncbi:MAG: 50S ribosomal protein L25 [Candidatus Omnitrophica bacterium]|nr:50S ribosomal protein L25 [Candidatus Omnitrophota bacterium]